MFVPLDPLRVQPLVDCVGTGRPAVQLAPAREEAVVVLAAAERARAMAGCERGRLVEEEQLREPPGLQERRAVPILEPQPACNPPFAVVAAADAAVVVVQAAAVAVDEAALGRGDEVTERRDAIPKWAFRDREASRPRRAARRATQDSARSRS